MKHYLNHIKKYKRELRLIILCELSDAYLLYQSFYLNECLLKYKTDYNSAESTSMLINTIFNSETTPSDFIESEDDSIDKVIDSNKEYKAFLNKTFLNKEIVDSFCRATEHNNMSLKFNIGFNHQIKILTLYNSGQLSKSQFEESFVDFCIFTRSTKKINLKQFKNTINSIEKLYIEILLKKTQRLNMLAH